jgi:hypothetical protein
MCVYRASVLGLAFISAVGCSRHPTVLSVSSPKPLPASPPAISATLNGGAWTETQDAKSDILRGLEVYVLRATVPRLRLSGVLARLSEQIASTKRAYAGYDRKQWAEEIGQVEAYETNLKKYQDAPPDRPIEVRKVFALIVGIPLATNGSEDEKRWWHLKTDTLWADVVAAAEVAKTTTDVEGKYRVPGLKAGRYVLHGQRSTSDYIMEWLTPFEVKEPGVITKDLHNKTAILILMNPGLPA